MSPFASALALIVLLIIAQFVLADSTTQPAIATPQLTPRPTWVAGVNAPVISLNGPWDFSAKDNSPFLPIMVPGEWAMQGRTVEPGAFATYRRSFDVPADWNGKLIKLRFDAVHAVCKVTINGQEIGGHEGGFVPFELDVTRAIKPGTNEIIVKVQCESLADSIACMSQYASHPVGGIIRKVTLFCVPQDHVANLNYSTTLEQDRALLRIHATSSLANPSAKITHELRDPRGQLVGTTDGDSITVRSPLLWTSETPDRYTLISRVVDSEQVTEAIQQEIGLRTVRVEGNQLLVNNRPVKLMGVNRHEVHPLTGRSVSPELCRRDVELFRNANVNLIRTSHYPPSEEFLNACDELGMFVECEAAVCWIKHNASPFWNTHDHLSPEVLPYLLRTNLDNVTANRNHPSIILWSLANESLWTPLFAQVNEQVKALDPTRPTAFHDQCWGSYNNAHSTADVAVYHYPGENNHEKWSEESRPVWFGEYAHVQCYNRRELVTDPGIRDDWGRPLGRMVDLMWSEPGCLGGAIWAGIDDVFHMPNGDLVGYGHWGIIDGWRRMKPELHGVKDAYTQLRISNCERQGDTLKLTVQNRFNFRNLKDVDIAASQGATNIPIKVDLAPHAMGTINLPLVSGSTEPVQLRLSRDNADPWFVTLPVVEPTVTRPPGRPEELTVDAKDGSICMGQTRIACPVPMILPLNDTGGAAGPAGTKLQNIIEPFTPTAANWKIESIESQGDSTVVQGKADDLTARIVFTRGQKELRVDYQFTALVKINPRQIGLVFAFPREFEKLGWRTLMGPFKVESDHFEVPPRTGDRDTVENVGVRPAHEAWSLDETKLGDARFRSTKTNIGWVLVRSKQQSMVILPPDFNQSARAWVEGGVIRLLVASFNTGGADHFFATHYAKERKPLNPGDVVSGSFIIQYRTNVKETH